MVRTVGERHGLDVLRTLQEAGHEDRTLLRAALLHDAGQAALRDASLMFWNTYNSNPLPENQASAVDRKLLPAEFLRYFE